MPALAIELPDAAVRRLSVRRERLVVAKCSAGGTPSIAWVAFPPRTATIVTWSEIYGVFAGRVPERAGSRLDVVDVVYPALERATYRFEAGAFGEPSADRRIPARHYQVQNAGPDPAAFGLAQRVSVNGRTAIFPVNLAVLTPATPAEFVPDDGIIVWSERWIRSGAVVSAVPANGLRLPHPSPDAVQRCGYDLRSEAFFLLSPPSDTNDLEKP